MAWLDQLKKNNQDKAINKITNHFDKKIQPVVTYGLNHPRQVELSNSLVTDLIIRLGLPISIVERQAFISFMKKVDWKLTMTSRIAISRKTIPGLYDKMNDQLKNFYSTATFLSLALDVYGLIEELGLFLPLQVASFVKYRLEYICLFSTCNN